MHALLAVALTLVAGPTSPKQFFGHEIGADYVLPNYKQLEAYWRKLDKDSDRMQVISIGKTEEGRDQLMAVVSDPANMRRLQQYKDIARKLCLAKGLSEADARKLSQDGKAVVWIDGGLHANEVLGAQQLIETCYQMVSGTDAETKRILKDCIILFVHANPDGMDLVSDWYMRNPDPKKRSTGNLPRLYQKYIGHDNNRDFYMSSQSETTNMNRIMYHEWFPQIVYNHHQTGPAGTVMFAPPFRDPFNYNFDPLIVSSLDLVSSAMMTRFHAEGKPGVTVRSGAPYSTWWNGGLRTTAYFHNMVGILTETIGNPTPMRIPFVPERLQPKADMIWPIEPQEWHFRQSVDYSVTANKAILDLASRYREEFLFNMYRMGKNSIERGTRDSWTITPSKIAMAKAAGKIDPLKSPANRDPRTYIIPADQDYFTAAKFVEALLKVGVQVERGRTEFTDSTGRSYPAGSFIVRCDQAFRPHILDMFEPQDHPNDLQYPGGPPVPPYDSAGYTLAMQMGIRYERLFTNLPIEGEPLTLGNLASTTPKPDALHNGAYLAAFQNLAAGKRQFLSRNGFSPSPADGALEVGPPRIALLDRFGGSMPSGWIRWIFDQFKVPYTVLYPRDLDAGINGKFDCVVIPSDISFSTRDAREVDQSTIPEEYRPRLGAFTATNSLPKLKDFVQTGGTVIAIGPATRVGVQLGIDVKSALVDEKGENLPRTKFYIPGSLMRVRIDNSKPVAWGLPDYVDVMFDEDPTYQLGDEVDRVGWYDSAASLRSGWALGQEFLKNTTAMAAAKLGAGTVYLFAPEITYRAQSWSTFKLLFNAILLSTRKESALR